jgi:hypothetical protein
MIEPLRKRRSDGTLYRRRDAVETELQELEKLELAHVVALAREPTTSGEDSISCEALMHVLRREVRSTRTDAATAGAIDALTAVLTHRCARIVSHGLGGYDEIDRPPIIEDVMDSVVDAIVEDSDAADYAEVNFNDWLMHRRLDAIRKHTRTAARMEHLGDAVEKLADDDAHTDPVDRDAQDDRTPETVYALNEVKERATLPPCMASADLSPDDQYRIAAMIKKADLPAHILNAFLAHHYLAIPIESRDSGQYTLVKHFGKSEKTIRLWIKRAEEAFTRLRDER